MSDQSRNLLDIDFNHHYRYTNMDNLIWGVGYQIYRDNISNNPVQHRTMPLYSTFFQNESYFWEDTLKIILGAKLEHHDISGFEFQPTIRFVWQMTDAQTLWGAISRASRTPSRTNRDLEFESNIFPGRGDSINAVVVFGNEDLRAENVLAHELGYRFRLHPHLSLDATLFYNEYEDSVTVERSGDIFIQPNTDPTQVIIPLQLFNNENDYVHGLELAIDWQTMPGWMLRASYSFLNITVTHDPGVQNGSKDEERKTPRHQYQLRSSWDIGENLELDANYRYIDAVPTFEIS